MPAWNWFGNLLRIETGPSSWTKERYENKCLKLVWKPTKDWNRTPPRGMDLSSHFALKLVWKPTKDWNLARNLREEDRSRRAWNWFGNLLRIETSFTSCFTISSTVSLKLVWKPTKDWNDMVLPDGDWVNRALKLVWKPTKDWNQDDSSGEHANYRKLEIGLETY